MSMRASTLADKLSLSNIITNIKDLHQQNDQSKEQELNQFFADQSLFSVPPILKESFISPMQQGGGLTLDEICRKKTESNWSHQTSFTQISKLSQINKKLLQDNKILIKECIRLRKILRSNNIQYGQERDYSSSNNSEFLTVEYINQINKLKMENLKLRMLQFISPTCDQKNKEIQVFFQYMEEIRATNMKLTHKIEQFMEREKNNKLSISETTTSISKSSDNEVDKVIKSMRIRYESQIKILKDEIEVQKEQIMRLSRSNRLGLQKSHQSPPVAKPF